MNIQSLQYFVILAKCKNFTVAAKECNITQSAFSRRIKSLEIELGVELLYHRKRGFQLTLAGERLLVHAHQILKDLDQLKDNINNENKMSDTKLNVTMIMPLAMTISGNIHDKMSAFNDLLRVKYTILPVYDGLSLLKKNQIDLLISYGCEHWSLSVDKNLYRFRTIGYETIIPVCHNTYYYDLNTYTDESIPILDHDPNNTILGITVNRMLEQRGKRNFNYIVESDFSYILYDMVCKGHYGVCWLPKSMVAGDIENNLLIHLGDEKWDFTYDIRIYINNDNSNQIAHTIADNIKL